MYISTTGRLVNEVPSASIRLTCVALTFVAVVALIVISETARKWRLSDNSRYLINCLAALIDLEDQRRFHLFRSARIQRNRRLATTNAWLVSRGQTRLAGRDTSYINRNPYAVIGRLTELVTREPSIVNVSNAIAATEGLLLRLQRSESMIEMYSLPNENLAEDGDVPVPSGFRRALRNLLRREVVLGAVAGIIVLLPDKGFDVLLG